MLAPERSRITFDELSGPSRLLSFLATYSYYCGSSTSSLTWKSIPVMPSGRFHVRARFVARLSTGRVTGYDYVTIWGRVSGSGKAAAVSVLVDFVYAGKHVADPYGTRLQSATAACETLVKGSAGA